MFKTIRSKILILIIGLMVPTSVTFIFITTNNFQTEITTQSYRLAKETLKSTINFIDTEYNDLLSYEINSINNQRSLMENVGMSILSMVDTFYDLQKTGLVTEQSAKEKCLKRLQEYRYQKNKYFFVYDLNLTGLSHPNKEMVGKKWAGFEDLKKKDALSLIRNIIETEEKAFTVFMWPRLGDMKQVKQIGYFFYYPQWEWIIGTVHEMGDIEKISLEKEKQILSKLNKRIGQAALNEIGGILIFNSSGRLIIHTSNLKNINLSRAGVILNKSIQDHLEEDISDSEKPVEYLYINEDKEEMIQIAYVDHYNYMDWHVAAFIDKNELKRPALDLAVRQSVILVLILLVGIVFAVFISKKIASPLVLLAEYSRNLPESNFTVKENSLLESIQSDNRNDEITQLADAFAFMESELGKNINELKRLNEHIVDSEEEERKTIAVDLHDSVAQTLALSIFKIKNMQESGAKNNSKDIIEIQGYLEQSVKDIRSLIYQLSPPILDDFEIDIALGYLIEEYNDKHQINIKYINNDNVPFLTSQAVKVTLYRSANELIVNIIKHSESKNAEIEISEKDNTLLLRVEDNGAGFDLNKLKNKNHCGFGIHSLTERINNLGGKIKLFSEPGRGTKILISIAMGVKN